MVGIKSPESLLDDIAAELRSQTDATSRTLRGEYWESLTVQVPGVGAAVAYAALDQFGTEIQVPVPEYWQLTQIDLIDPDDEGAAFEIWLARQSLGVTSSDNDALVISDGGLRHALGRPVSLSGYGDANTGQIGSAVNIDRLMHTPSRILYVQLQTLGTPNIAAGMAPSIRLIGLT